MNAVRMFACFLFSIPIMTFSQEIQQSVIASAGSHYETTSATLSWTLGEVAVGTIYGNTFVIGQGFQQGDLTITSLQDEPIAGIFLKAYPNPVQNKLTVDFKQDKLYYSIVDINGKQLNNGFLNSGSGILDFENAPKGTYFLIIDNKEAYKIIKQ